jgi:hypothetical protein
MTIREDSLRSVVREFVAHCHLERNHQGLGNRLIKAILSDFEVSGSINRRQRIGGILNYYYRAAACLSHVVFSVHTR